MLKLLTNKDYPDPFWPAVFAVAACIVILIFAKMLWRMMKENNIFMKEDLGHYAHRENEVEKSKQIAHGRYLFYGAAVMNVLYFFVAACDVMGSNKRGADFIVSYGFEYTWKQCFLPMIVLFIYSHINESVFAFLINFKYAISVWFTTILVVAVVFTLMLLPYADIAHGVPQLYFRLLLALNNLGCMTYFALIYGMHFISRRFAQRLKRKIILSMLVQAVLFVNVLLLNALFTGTFISFFISWLICALILQIAIRILPIDDTIYSDDTTIEIKAVEVIDDEKGRNKLA